MTKNVKSAAPSWQVILDYYRNHGMLQEYNETLGAMVHALAPRVEPEEHRGEAPWLKPRLQQAARLAWWQWLEGQQRLATPRGAGQ